ncbi:MAG: IPExxxVDY family protein [Flavobacteriales bacterium]
MFHQLEVAYDYDFLLFGISCHEKIYRLSWFLNRELSMELAWCDELEMKVKGETSTYPYYRFEDLENETIYTLIQNRGAHGWFIPEMKQMDYLLKIELGNDLDLEAFLKGLRNVPVVNGSYNLLFKAFKSKENLIFD